MADAKGIDASVLLAALRSAERTAPSESESEPVRLAMASGDHRAALELSASLLRSRRATPQLITAFCGGLFRSAGPACLSSLFAALREMVGPSWERVHCASNREKQCEAALNAALRDIATCWQFAVAQPSTQSDWAPFDRAAALSTASDVASFRAAFAARWDNPRFSTQLSAIEALLRAVRPVAAPIERTSAAHDAPASRVIEPEPAVPARDDRTLRAPPSADEPAPHREERAVAHDEIVLPVTAALRELLEKLEGFDALIERGDSVRAAIIADDVQSLIDDFDPRRFFPALFAAHIARRVEHRAALSEARQLAADERNELEQLYRVDLPAFVGR